MYKGARSSAVVALLVIVAGLAVAACGSSNSSTPSASSGGGSSTTGTSTTPGRGGFFSNLTATQKSCLKSHGVTLPTGGGRGFRPGSGTGTFTRPSGTPTGGYPGGGYPGGGYPGGGYPGGGAPPGGTSTNGTPPTGGFGGGGFGGRGFGGANSKFATAFKACGITFSGHFGAGRFGGRPGAGGGFKPTTAALKTFVACVDKNGYDLKDSQLNTTGKGSILPKSLETNKKFIAAATPCERDLFPTGGSGGPPSGTGPTTSG